MYKVVITKKIFSPVDLRISDNKIINLYYETELPFAPFIGLRIALPEMTIGPLNGVVYDTQTGWFHCSLEHTAFGLEELHKVEEAVERAKEDGWKIKNE